ncbi:MAG TPA: hypothetical protein VGA56_23440 [Opitutaceae bacterium]
MHERARDQWNGFDLFRIKDGEKAEWLLRKRLDLATRGGGRTEGGKQGDRGDRPGPAGDGALQAQLATLVRKPPSGGEWCYEVKWDGYRLLAERSGQASQTRRCIEFYGWGSRVDQPRQADQLVFDLDPAGDVHWGKS